MATPEQIADVVVADLFTNAVGQRADVLRLVDHRGDPFGVWTSQAVREHVVAILKNMLAVLLLLACALPAAAGERPLFVWSEEQRPIAKAMSDALVVSAIALDAVHSLRADDRAQAFTQQGCHLGAAVGLTVGLKNLVRRGRPDGSNRFSFPSGHTANAFASAGWKWSVGVPIALGAGFGRMGAKKHYASDIAGGALIGLFSGWLCERIF